MNVLWTSVLRLGLSVTSSEKVESDRYSNFKINAMPYPGCEFFRIFKQSNYNGSTVFARLFKVLIRCQCQDVMFVLIGANLL